MARKHPEINAALRAAFEASGLKKMEVARQLWGDEDRWRDFDRYLKTTTPGAAVAIELARIFDKPVGAFIPTDPIHALAQELMQGREGRESIDRRLESLARQVARGTRANRKGLARLADEIAVLARRLPPEAQTKQGTGP